MLRASGAGEAEAILVCVDKRDAADRIVALVKAEFPLAKLLVRSYDRGHALKLIEAGVDLQIRETFESALEFGESGAARARRARRRGGGDRRRTSAAATPSASRSKPPAACWPAATSCTATRRSRCPSPRRGDRVPPGSRLRTVPEKSG